MIFPKAKLFFSNGNKILPVWFMFLAIGWITPWAMAEDQAALQENPPTSEEFLRGALRSLLEETFADFPKTTSGLVILKAEEARSENWLLEDELVAYLISLNYQVSLNANDSNTNLSESKFLFYRIIDLKLDYPKVRRKGFLKEKLVTRTAGLNLSFREEKEATGEVLWSKRVKQEKTDVVRKSMIKSLNNPAYPFLCPSLSGDSLSKYVEPALVTAVVGGLVYLFFANR